jgi:hypothetical protein
MWRGGGGVNIKVAREKIPWQVWTVFICLRTGTGGGLIGSINYEIFVS